MMLKIGFDIHGVLDTHDSIVKLSQILYTFAGAEVHVITGNSHTDEIKAQLRELGVHYEFFFSITDHLEAKGMITWRDGYPYCSDEAMWDQAKSVYCKENDIHLLLDDSPRYGDHFTEIDTIFCEVKRDD